VLFISISRSGGAVAEARYCSTVSGRLFRHAQTTLGTKDEKNHLVDLARFIAKGIESPFVTVISQWESAVPKKPPR